VNKMASLLAFLSVVLPSALAVAQPSQLVSCLEEGSYCSESTLDTLLVPDGQDCGVTFYQFTGRVAFPALVNEGPITISVLTRAPSFSSLSRPT